MKGLSSYPIPLLAVLGLLAAGLAACSDDPAGGGSDISDASDAPLTLTDELTAAGLPPGSWRVQSGGSAVCTHTFTYPGSPAPVTESIDLSGFATFDLLVDNEFPALRGAYDELAAQWTDGCVVFTAGTDAVTNHTTCGGDEEDPCTPFNLVRLCSADGEPTFYAQVPECGFNTFPASPQ